MGKSDDGLGTILIVGIIGAFVVWNWFPATWQQITGFWPVPGQAIAKSNIW